jgi:hypothetical protein
MGTAALTEADGLPRLSETQLIEELSESIRKSDMGATKSAQQISKSMRKKYADIWMVYGMSE